VVDLSGEARRLQLKRSDNCLEFNLYANGMKVFPGWHITIDRPNTLRADFTGGDVFEFECREALSYIVIAVSKFGEEPQLTLNGELLNTTDDACFLPHGFNELYRQSTPLSLEEGTHSLCISDSPNDFPYLPAVFIAGDFSCKDNILSAYKNDGYGLSGYAGKIRQTTNITIPESAIKFTTASDGLCTEAIFNGHSLGKKLWEPFEWVIPNDLQGETVELQIVRLTSCGKLFGENAFDKPSYMNWLNKYKPDNSTPLKPFCEIRWT
jgi:hypothetical protein